MNVMQKTRTGHSNAITPREVIRSLSDSQLHAISQELLEWQATGRINGLQLIRLCSDLVRDTGLLEDGITQVAEPLVLQEICVRWAASFAAPVALRYRMRGDLQWQYTENLDQARHASEIQRLQVVGSGPTSAKAD